MGILQRYIAKTVILATCLAGFVLASVVFLMTLLGEVKNIGKGDFGLLEAVIFVLMRMPNELYQFSPMFILLGSIIGLSALSSHRELAVMRASGFAIRQIMLSVLSAAFMMVVMLSIMGEAIGPYLSYRAEVRKENAQHAGQAVVTAAGIWFHIDNNFIHVKQVVGRQLLKGVTRYQFDHNHRLQVAYYAKTLSLEKDGWVMNDVLKTSFYEERTKSFVLPLLPWDLKLNTNLLTIGLVNPEEMSLSKLAKFSEYLKQNGLRSSEYQYVFWQRIFQPLASLIMIMLAVPFVLGTLSTSTMGWRIMMGVLIGFAFFILNALLGQLCVVYQIPTMVAALFPLLLFSVIAFFVYTKTIKT